MADNDDDIAVLQNEIKNLRDLVRELKATIISLSEKLDNVDRRHNDSCRTCTAWTRISAMEISNAEIKATARGWAMGASAISGGLSFIAAWLLK